MLYTTLTIGDKEYKCRLNAKACVDLEKRLGTNPLNILGQIAATKEIPALTTLLTVLHASLQAMEHGITVDKVYEMYDAYCEEGHTVVDLIAFIVDIYKVSGFINEEQLNQDTKN